MQREMNAQTAAIVFAIIANIAVALIAFPMVPIVEQLHRFSAANIESLRMAEGARVALWFSLVPIAAVLITRWLPVSPVAPSPSDPLYEDLAWTIQVAAALLIAAFTLASGLLRMSGVGGDAASAAIQALIYTGIAVYTVLLGDSRNPFSRSIDLVVMASIAGICIIYVHRENILLAIPLLVRHGQRVKLKWIFGLVLAMAAVIALSSLARANLDLQSNLIRVLGNQYKFLERYAMNFGIYDRCFGSATLFAFINPEKYNAFYNLIFDPVMLTSGGVAFRWDSSNLLERLNYAYCSVSASYLIYFGFLGLLLYMEKKLSDIRYFRVAFLTVMLSYGGFGFYSIFHMAALLLLFLSGFWRIGRHIFAAGPHQGASSTDWSTSA